MLEFGSTYYIINDSNDGGNKIYLYSVIAPTWTISGRSESVRIRRLNRNPVGIEHDNGSFKLCITSEFALSSIKINNTKSMKKLMALYYGS